MVADGKTFAANVNQEDNVTHADDAADVEVAILPPRHRRECAQTSSAIAVMCAFVSALETHVVEPLRDKREWSPGDLRGCFTPLIAVRVGCFRGLRRMPLKSIIRAKSEGAFRCSRLVREPRVVELNRCLKMSGR